MWPTVLQPRITVRSPAYGKNTEAGILRDADLMASIAPAGDVGPHIVIDVGYQDVGRFPNMAKLASEIRSRNLLPGVWVRPLQASKTARPAWLLPKSRFGKMGVDSAAFDPTIPEALDEVLKTICTPVDWGYEFIKHDFSTWELFGRWGFAMDTGSTVPGWQFQDRSRTNAEIVADLYRAIRNAGQNGSSYAGQHNCHKDAV